MWEELNSFGLPTHELTQHHLHPHTPSAISCAVPAPCHGLRTAPAAPDDPGIDKTENEVADNLGIMEDHDIDKASVNKMGNSDVIDDLDIDSTDNEVAEKVAIDNIATQLKKPTSRRQKMSRRTTWRRLPR